MPKRLSIDLSEAIVKQLRRHRAPMSVDELHNAIGDRVSRRTLQRWLQTLVQDNVILADGRGRARVYKTESEPQTITTTGSEAYVPLLSAESDQIRSYVRKPIQEREPTGYDRSLLEAYDANNTYYLSKELRDHLRALGTVERKTRPAGTYAREILGRLLIDLSWASSRLEGNTYTRLDTKNLIELGQAAEGKDRSEAQMILNHKAAIELLVENAETINFDTFTFFNLHSTLSDNLLADPRESGRIRARVVHISGTAFQPLSIPQQLNQFFRLILDKARMIDDPFEQALFVMVHVPYLQPFVDVNKRVSRLGANISLIKRNLVPLSFVDVPERAYVEGTLGVYELRKVELIRDVFVWAYERSCKRYAVIKDSVAAPDPVRLRNREALISIIGEIVRANVVPTRAAVSTLAHELVSKKDREAFIEMTLEDLAELHEGNVSRYRLRLSEYLAWSAGRSPTSRSL